MPIPGEPGLFCRVRTSGRHRVFGLAKATIAVLPCPLRLLHGPLPVTLETWSYGVVVAHLDDVGLWADGTSADEALIAISAEVAEFFADVSDATAKGVLLGGPLAKQWATLCALVAAS